MDVTPAIFDPEMGCTAFSVKRITFTNSRTGLSESSRTFQVMGSIHPGTPEMLQLLPEEERGRIFIVIYTDFLLSTGTPDTAAANYDGADRIQWNSQLWRVVRVRDWMSFGYVQALAVLMSESET